MSVIHTESAITVGNRYTIQTVSKFPQDKNFLIGKTVTVQSINGQEVSVRLGNSMPHWIPIRSLFFVDGYEIKGVHAENANGFMLKTPYAGYLVGTAFLEPTKVKDDSITFTVEGKELIIPRNCFFHLVRKVVKIKDKKVRKEASQVGVPYTVVESIAGAIIPEQNKEMPSAVNKLLPSLNLEVLIDTIKNNAVEVFDFEGEVHNSVQAALLSNNAYIHRLIQKTVLLEVNKLLEEQFKALRNEDI